MAELDILADLLEEGKKASRAATIKKAAKKVEETKSKQPLEDGPPIRRDVYQQLEWRALSVTLITVHTTCTCCGSSSEAPNPSIFIERYHRRHGRHLVEAHNFNLLPRKEVEALPRKVETRYVESLYCHQCFLSNQESLCLDLQLTQTQESSPYPSLPCVPQAWAIPSFQTLWSDTLGKTSRPMNISSLPSEPNKPAAKQVRYY